MKLLQHDSPHFAVVRDDLRQAGFSDKSICSRLGIPALTALLTLRRKDWAPVPESDELSLLIRLLLMGESIEKKTLESGLTTPIMEALAAVGLAIPDPGDDARIMGAVVLYPIGSLFIASDRWFAPDGREYKAPDDIVYPAITPNTAEFMATLPLTPCENFLELCSGTGAVALAATAYADKSWAIDIIPRRSTKMAEFNRLLNGLSNVNVLKGDLYEGVDGMMFDRIVAHPPYMPVLSRAQIFYDGGADGEQITRRCIEALPRYLKAGGRFYCQAQGSDRAGAPLESRIRGWLGESQADFDVAVVEKRAQSPKDAAYVYALKSSSGFETVQMMLESLAALGVESMAYGWIVIQRKDSDRKVFTVRRFAGQRTGREEIAWLLKWESYAATAGREQFAELRNMIPSARPSLELNTIYRLKNGDLAPEQFTLHTDDPFSMNCQVQPWVGFLIPLCDGKLTVQEVFESCKANGIIHTETPPGEFAQLICTLISGGFLEVAEYPLPNPHSGEPGTRAPKDSIQEQLL